MTSAPTRDACRFDAADRTTIADRLAAHYTGTGQRDPTTAHRLAAHAIGCSIDDLRDSELDEITALVCIYNDLKPGQLAAVAVNDNARAVILVSAVVGTPEARQALADLTAMPGLVTLAGVLYHHPTGNRLHISQGAPR